MFSIYLHSQNRLVFSAVENSPPVITVGQLLKEAYSRLGIEIEILELPGERALSYSNTGKTDGETFRISGIESDYPNLIKIEVPVQIDQMYVYVTKGKEFTVNGWESIPKNYVLGYKTGLKYIDYAVERYQIKHYSIRSLEQIFKMLYSGRIDLIVAGEEQGKRYLSSYEYRDIRLLKPSIQENYLYHYLNKRHIDLVPKITEELERIVKEKNYYSNTQ